MQGFFLYLDDLVFNNHEVVMSHQSRPFFFGIRLVVCGRLPLLVKKSIFLQSTFHLMIVFIAQLNLAQYSSGSTEDIP